MAQIIPFRGIRPAEKFSHLIPSQSIDRYSKTELHQHLTDNPYSFLHIIQPDFKDGLHTEAGSTIRLEKVKKTYQTYIQQELLVKDQQPNYYLYRQTAHHKSYTGIIGCINIDDYFNGNIKIHEQTLTDREEKLKDYLAVCGFNAEPVLFCYPPQLAINQITQKHLIAEPSVSFSSSDGLKHELWIINQPQEIETIQHAFEQLGAVYIADGHHRSASSALLGKMRRQENPNYTGDEAFNYYLGIFFPENDLSIVDYNRLVKDLNGLSSESFIAQLEETFTVEKIGKEPYTPKHLHNFSLYINHNWYSLTPHVGKVDDTHPVKSLDASILTEAILSPLLQIEDLKTDKRIKFMPGIHGMKALQDQVDQGKAAAAFGLFPVSMKHLKWIADTNNCMPPKSTWIEPKMRNGLVIYSMV